MSTGILRIGMSQLCHRGVNVKEKYLTIFKLTDTSIILSCHPWVDRPLLKPQVYYEQQLSFDIFLIRKAMTSLISECGDFATILHVLSRKSKYIILIENALELPYVSRKSILPECHETLDGSKILPYFQYLKHCIKEVIHSLAGLACLICLVF
jgi:hypothetical protein